VRWKRSGMMRQFVFVGCSVGVWRKLSIAWAGIVGRESVSNRNGDGLWCCSSRRNIAPNGIPIIPLCFHEGVVEADKGLGGLWWRFFGLVFGGLLSSDLVLGEKDATLIGGRSTLRLSLVVVSSAVAV